MKPLKTPEKDERQKEKNLMKARGLRHNLYERIDVPLWALDVVIAVLSLSVIVIIMFGAAQD